MKVNSRREWKNHVKPITLRSGRELVTPRLPLVVLEVETETTYQTKQEEQLEAE